MAFVKTTYLLAACEILPVAVEISVARSALIVRPVAEGISSSSF